ncbi:LysE family transporter [Paenibacillus sp. JTLBN-2024]
MSKSFSAGFVMSISNPLSILFWMGIYGSVLADMIAKYDARGAALSCAIMAGIMLWDVAMALAASMFRRMLTERLIKGISVISGLSLIGFGLYFRLRGMPYFVLPLTSKMFSVPSSDTSLSGPSALFQKWRMISVTLPMTTINPRLIKKPGRLIL